MRARFFIHICLVTLLVGAPGGARIKKSKPKLPDARKPYDLTNYLKKLGHKDTIDLIKKLNPDMDALTQRRLDQARGRDLPIDLAAQLLRPVKVETDGASSYYLTPSVMDYLGFKPEGDQKRNPYDLFDEMGSRDVKNELTGLRDRLSALAENKMLPEVTIARFMQEAERVAMKKGDLSEDPVKKIQEIGDVARTLSSSLSAMSDSSASSRVADFQKAMAATHGSDGGPKGREIDTGFKPGTVHDSLARSALEALETGQTALFRKNAETYLDLDGDGKCGGTLCSHPITALMKLEDMHRESKTKDKGKQKGWFIEQVAKSLGLKDLENWSSLRTEQRKRLHPKLCMAFGNCPLLAGYRKQLGCKKKK